MKISAAFFAVWLLPVSYSLCQAEESRIQIDLSRKLENYFEEISDTGFAFSVLVAVNGEVITQKGYGWIDPEKKKPASGKTVFNVASITKSFTAAGIFILQEKNLLSINNSLSKFFPDIPEDKKAITIVQLMAHSTGLGQNYLSDRVKERDSAVKVIFTDLLQFKSGTNFSYSNENYEILGALIEIISHQTYEEFIRENILKKAGMNNTWFWSEASGIDSNLIAGKNRILDQSISERNWGYIGSGGIYTNAGDLYKWFNALADGRIIGRGSLKTMWTPQLKLNDIQIGSGWFISDTPWGKEIWTRGSEDWGHNAVLRWFPERKTIIIVMSNSGEIGNKNITANRFISDEIIKIIFK